MKFIQHFHTDIIKIDKKCMFVLSELIQFFTNASLTRHKQE